MSINSFQVSKRFSEKEVIKDFTFEAPAGQITVLIGPNGCGKTTWINIALELLKSNRGIVRFEDKLLREVRQEISVVYDEVPVIKYLDGYDNLFILSGCDVKNEKVRTILDILGLDDSVMKMKGKAFSFGQKHKLAVAAALIRNPKYFFLDEPAVGLDLESWEKVSAALIGQAKKGSSILITGHNYDLLEEIADNIVIVKNGIVHFQGTKKQLLEHGTSLKNIYRKLFMEEKQENFSNG